MTLAVALDAIILLVVVPQALGWASLSLVSLTGCSGIGCEGPTLVTFLFVIPFLWVVTAVVYVVVSIRKGRSPGMAALSVPARSRRPGEGRGPAQPPDAES